MKTYIAIPSYKRSQTIVEKTLKYLMETDVFLKDVTVFVADKKELQEYIQVLKVDNKIKDLSIIVGVPTLRGQRKFIREYYPSGSHVFSIDDDIEGIYEATKPTRDGLKKLVELKGFLSHAEKMCRKFDITLWGTSAVFNPFFMYGKGVSFDLKYICGGAYGEIVSRDKSLDVILEDKEDFERSIRHFIKKGRVMRYNSFALNTQGYKGAGGMQETRTKERVSNSAKWLLKEFPKYCKLNTGKKNQEWMEVQLIKQ
jgi:hypothetical protein